MNGTNGTWLTVDCGNSRCKLVLWGDPETGIASDGPATPPVLARAELATGPDLVEALEAWLEVHRPVAAALTSVGAADLTAELRGLLEGFTTVFVDEPDAGLDVRCEPPEAVGRDRLYAARGALETLGGAALVVDAGTALTVDAARAGVFLGGAIAPGAALSARALAQHTARLPEVELRPGAAALGRDTEAAIRSGVVVGFRGAAAALVEAIAAEAGLDGENGAERTPVAVTGGARALLLEPRPFSGRRCVELRHLVNLGLLYAAAGID